MAVSTGWTFPQVAEHDLWDLQDLTKYWADRPPLHVMAAAYLGISKKPAKRATPEALRKFASAFGMRLPK